MSTPTIPAGNKFMDTLLWSGTGGSASATRALTGLSFQPDFTWEKALTSTQDYHMFDSVRGAGLNKTIASNSTNGQGSFNDTLYGYLSSFDSNGITTTNGSSTWDNWNKSGDNYLAWNWKANGTAVSNTSGSITSSVSANTTAGFSVVTYTSTTGTVGHGLGVAPAFIIMKQTNNTDQWTVGHVSLNGGSSPWNYGLPLNATSGTQTNSGFWNNTAPTSTVFSQGSWGSGFTKVAYCWTPIAGFSQFSSYTGNGSADGPFVYCGFRPKWIMFRATDVESWELMDTSRSPYNQAINLLEADSASPEAVTSVTAVDFLSNGFKLRNTRGAMNGSGRTYIYAAFAENPFKYANAR